MTEQSVENIFGRAWDLLVKNKQILVPGLIIGLLTGIISGLLGSTFGMADASDPTAIPAAGAVSRGFAAATLGAVAILASLLNNAYTIGMAGAAWQKGFTTYADGAAAFRNDGGRLFVAIVLLFVIEVVLAVVTLGVGALIFEFFALYVFAAVVVGSDAFGRALRESFAIATRRFVPTLIIVVALFLISLVVGLVTLPLRFIPLLGPIVVAVIVQAVVSYINLVIVGEYLNARNAPDVVAAE